MTPNPRAINKLRQRLIKRNLDAFLITKQANVAYLSGFEGEGQLLITPTKKILIVDFRFKEEALNLEGSLQICLRQGFYPLEKSISELAKKLKLKRLGFEELALSYGLYYKLEKALKPIRFLSTNNMVEQLRAIKSAQEIAILRKATSLAIKSCAFAKEIIKPGQKEAAIVRKVQNFMRKSGAENSAFETIVASGKRSSMPHARASGKIIKENEAVLVDLGCRISGYNSDLTRMAFLGKMGAKIKRVYGVVLRAQGLAIKAVKAGVEARQIDQAARQYIAKSGLGAFFGHALGHGIGREVHEAPSISPNSKDILREAMVFTIEPGVYIPGLGGVRVEDMVLVTNKGCEILTKTNELTN